MCIVYIIVALSSYIEKQEYQLEFYKIRQEYTKSIETDPLPIQQTF